MLEVYTWLQASKREGEEAEMSALDLVEARMQHFLSSFFQSRALKRLVFLRRALILFGLPEFVLDVELACVPF